MNTALSISIASWWFVTALHTNAFAQVAAEPHGLFEAHLDAIFIMIVLFMALLGTIIFLWLASKRTRKAELQLKAETEKYADLFRHASEGIVLVDRDGRIQDINPRASAILGIVPDQVQGVSGASIIHPDDGAITPEQRLRLDAGMAMRATRRIRTKTGSYVPVEVSVKHISKSLTQILIHDLSEAERARIKLEDANRELAGMYEQVAAANDQLSAANRDLHYEIEARNRAEQDLREREALFDSVLRAAPLGIGMVRNRVVGWTNRTLQTMLGYSGEQLMDMPARQLYEDEDEFRRVGEVKHPQIAKNEFGSVETRMVTSRGKVLEVLLSSGTIKRGDMDAGLIFTVQDLSALRTAQKETRTLREVLFRDSSVAQLLLVPETGEILDANRAAADFFALPHEKLAGMNVDGLLRANGTTPNSAIEQTARAGGTAQFRCGPDERERVLETRAEDFDMQGKRVRHMTVHDVSERQKTQDALLLAKNLAEDASRMKNEFLANMSHEVRTPLNGMLGMLQLLLDTRLNSEQIDLVDAAMQSGRGLNTLLNDLLDFSMIEAGRLPLKSTDFDLRHLLENITMVFRRQCLEKQIRLGLEIDDDVPGHVHGDKGRLRQILFNLTGNAVKFTDSGSVTIRAASLETHGKSDFRVMFTVEDSGIGIDDEKLDQVFEPFTQADGSMTRQYEGAGLGLSIVRRLASFMNGSVAAESWPGSGTAMHVVLPFSRPREKSRPEAVLSPPAEQNRQKRILIAEDNRINSIAAKRFVEKIGYEASCVADGGEVIKRLRAERFDGVLMDVQMPAMSGTEATRLIRSDTSGDFDPAIPIIAMTAHAMAGDRERFLEQGMTAYLAKPVSYAELAKTLEKHV